MHESISTLRDLLWEPDFRRGIGLGVIAALALVGWARMRRPGPWAGLTAVAVLVGVAWSDEAVDPPIAGCLLLGIGGAIIDHGTPATTSRRLLTDRNRVGIAIAVIGAVVVGLSMTDETPIWVSVLAPAYVLVLAALLAWWDRAPEANWLGPVFAISAFGVWTTVPDTELAQLLLGVALVTGLTTLPPIAARVTGPGAFALAGVFVWLPTVGGAPRPASIVGAWATIGVIALLPAARRLWTARLHLVSWRLLVIQALMAVVAARIIGLWTWAVPAALAALALFAVGLGLVRIAATPVRPRSDR